MRNTKPSPKGIYKHCLAVHKDPCAHVRIQIVSIGFFYIDPEYLEFYRPGQGHIQIGKLLADKRFFFVIPFCKNLLGGTCFMFHGLPIRLNPCYHSIEYCLGLVKITLGVLGYILYPSLHFLIVDHRVNDKFQFFLSKFFLKSGF